jgi:hypothetical protein
MHGTMVEKRESLYDVSGSLTPLVSADYLVDESEPARSSTSTEKAIDGQGECVEGKPSAVDDRENIQVAGIGSAVVGLIVGGPLLAIVLGFGAVYAAERNPDFRNKFGDVWANVKRFDKEYNIIKKGSNSIGKGTIWLIDKITGKHTNQESDTLDAWVAAQSAIKK